MKRFLNTYLYESGTQANGKGFKCYDLSKLKNKKQFVKDFGLAYDIIAEKKFIDNLTSDRLDSYISSIVKRANENEDKMFFSNTKEV